MRIEIEGIIVEHSVNLKLKHAYLQVDSDGTVILKSNGKNLPQLKRFVVSKRGWIERQQKSRIALPTMHPGRTILYLGEIVTLEAIGVELTSQPSIESTRKSYDRFYRDRAEAVLVEKTHAFAARMNVAFTDIRFRKMKRRWGSCSKAGVITYNTLLMQLPEAMIDYTVIHELAHRVHFNHSPDFHALVSFHLPGERELRREMRHMKVCGY